MDRLSKALSLNQNRSSNYTKEKEENMITQKNGKSLQDWKLPPPSASDAFRRKGTFHFTPPLGMIRSSNYTKEKEENMISQKNEKSLQDWKLPPSPPSDSFKRKGIFHFSPDRTVKTVEREIRLSEGFSSIPLITENPQRNKTLHVGMIQVALKPTKLGSDTSAVICLRDKRFLKFNLSVLAMVESSLCDGPIYFFYFPSHCLSMSDPYLKSTFAVDVKTQGSGAILMYRFHYKVTEADVFAPDPKKTRNPIDGVKGTTTLFVTDVARNNSVVSNKIYWDQVTVPDIWKVRSDPPSSSSAGGQVAVASAPVDWKEAAEAHVLKVDVPGLKKEEIRVEVEDGGILQISGERRKEEAEEDEKWLCVERSSGKFVRRLKLPENAKLDEVKAAVENGVLTVTAPKMEVGKKPLVKVIDISG